VRWRALNGVAGQVEGDSLMIKINDNAVFWYVIIVVVMWF